ncbi:hypothetical protein GCM10023322_34900 [Rugosimonospora acidiphila]|uniref:LarA-like N-terminal domain-containing protein n=1 Tax=Rugosimonospora acidiphila TaxID=556531 RepID=A0ABP9RW99_9ACTN
MTSGPDRAGWTSDPRRSDLVARVGARVRLPSMRLVRRRGAPSRIADLDGVARAEVRRAIGGAAGIGGPRRGAAGIGAAESGAAGDGAPVAVAVGSRGIAHLAELVAAAVDELRRAGFAPFIVPAMGSHGGGTAEGQAAVLAGYGITEQRLGVPVRAGMDTEVVGEVDGVPVHLDRYVARAGRAFLVARVKPHTDFRGGIESGAAKLAAIGLGKQAGAQELHGRGIEGLRETMPAVGRYLADRYLLGALAVVEDEFDETLVVRGLVPGDIGRAGERELLELARRSLPRLPVEGGIDVLVVSRMGKDISGTGMDPNVIGRWLVPGLAEPDPAPVRAVVALNLTEASHGNAIGVGLADFVPARLVSGIDLDAFYLNVMTAGWAGLRRGRLPVVLPTDRDAIVAALAVCGPEAARRPRLVWIRDTLHTQVCAVSEALWSGLDDGVEPDAGEPFALPFDAHGALPAGFLPHA